MRIIQVQLRHNFFYAETKTYNVRGRSFIECCKKALVAAERESRKEGMTHPADWRITSAEEHSGTVI